MKEKAFFMNDLDDESGNNIANTFIEYALTVIGIKKFLRKLTQNGYPEIERIKIKSIN